MRKSLAILLQSTISNADKELDDHAIPPADNLLRLVSVPISLRESRAAEWN